MIHGECLCGAVAFDVARDGLDIYQCHCSLCRRATGSNANAGAIVDVAEFAWAMADPGGDAIGSHRCLTGYRNDFCRRCGSTVPNLMADGLRVWLPAGLLGDHPGIRLVRHLHLESRAQWDPVAPAD